MTTFDNGFEKTDWLKRARQIFAIGLALTFIGLLIIHFADGDKRPPPRPPTHQYSTLTSGGVFYL